MGKYSLDAFEVYPLTKLRPSVTEQSQSCYRLLELSRAELEPGSGMLPPPEIEGDRVLLCLRWDTEDDIMDACGFIRRMGSCYAGGKALAGVVMMPGLFRGAALSQLVHAYRQGFDKTVLLAQPETELAGLFRREGIPTGLWLHLSEGVLNLRRSIAKDHLARNWEKAPVYLYAEGELSEGELDAARRWHCSGANVMAPLGPQMALRRMMFPRDLTSGGVMPLRVWLQNIGTAPVYREVSLRLVLRSGGEQYTLEIPGTMRPGMGDTTFNTTVRLPRIPCGDYSLWVGLETENGFLPLANDAPEKDGLYHIGELALDDVLRPYLSTMWEEQYADGYYPLEDPAQPE